MRKEVEVQSHSRIDIACHSFYFFYSILPPTIFCQTVHTPPVLRDEGPCTEESDPSFRVVSPAVGPLVGRIGQVSLGAESAVRKPELTARIIPP